MQSNAATTHTQTNAHPSAPSLHDLLTQEIYGEEEGCDAVFFVGHDETWRIPAHKTILQNATPVFRAMFSEPFLSQGSQGVGVGVAASQPQTIRVPDVDARAFDYLLRHLYGQPVIFQSVETALKTLYASHKYQCPGLVGKCVDYLNDNLSVANILFILSNVPLFCGNVQNLENWGRERQMMQEQLLVLSCSQGGHDNLPNFSQVAFAQQNPDSLDSIETECGRLLQNCLRFVDREATAVLQLDEMEDLEMETFRLILSRDTLDVADENLVFSVILKWTDKECKRQLLPLTSESKRSVLGECLFLPRYLTMNLQSFQCDQGPSNSGLFTADEVECLTRILRKGLQSDFPSPNSSPQNNPLGIPSSLRPYYRMLSRPRCPIRDVGYLSPAKKSKTKKGLSLNFIEKWRRTRRSCCRSRQNQNQNQRSRSNNSSQQSSPARSNLSSPVHRDPHPNYPEKPKRLNVAVERIVVFLACLFD